MKLSLLRIALGLAAVLLFLLHATGTLRLEVIDRLDAMAYDAQVRLTMPGGQDDRVVIVDIDEPSLVALGRWPWSRDVMTRLVDQLFDRYGVAVVAFDVVFAQADRSSGLAQLEQLARGALADDARYVGELGGLRSRLDYDRQFADALRRRPAVLGYYLTQHPGIGSSGALPTPLPAGFADPEDARHATHWLGFGGNLAEFQGAAMGGGHFNYLVELDGITRRVPLVIEQDGHYYEALSLATLRAYLARMSPDRHSTLRLLPADDRSGSRSILLSSSGRTVRVMVDDQLAVNIPFRGVRGSFRYLSAIDVIGGKVDAAALRGRIALVGSTAAGILDLRATPVSAAYPGAEVHANLIAGMLDNTIKYRPDYSDGAEPVILLVTGLLMVFLLPRLPFVYALAAGIACVLAVLAVDAAFWSANQLFPVVGILLQLFFLYSLNMSWGYFAEARIKRQFKRLFGQYVPPELVEKMSRDPTRYSMAGRKEELTVLFSDVRSFTTISEGLEPEQLAHLMNLYLGAMTDVIRNDFGGTLDKYIGDAIMAFWGAPVSDAEHARKAVLSALAMLTRLATVNQALERQGLPQLQIGIGINSGPMTVGDMGSPVRKAYTVMGDAVNLASRLEGITKVYGVGVVVGERTRALASGIVYRELDRVRVKGKDQAVVIHEPIGLPEQLDAAQDAELEAWKAALDAYLAQDWEGALSALTVVERGGRSTLLCQLYRRRIAEFMAHPPGVDWDGTAVFTEK